MNDIFSPSPPPFQAAISNSAHLISRKYRHIPGLREIDFQFADFMVRLAASTSKPPTQQPLTAQLTDNDTDSDKTVNALFQSALMLSYLTGLRNSAMDLKKTAGRPIEAFIEIEERIPPTGISFPSFDTLLKMLNKHPAVVGIVPDHFTDHIQTPMLLDEEGKLYLNRYWQYELKVAQAIRTRLSWKNSKDEKKQVQKIHNENEKEKENGDGGTLQPYFSKTTQPLIERLFPPPSHLKKKSDTHHKKEEATVIHAIDWQKIACLAAFQSGFTIISGGPGTGKTTTVSKLLALLLHENPTLEVDLVAPTGKAADRLMKSIQSAKLHLDIPDSLKEKLPDTARTIHRYLGYLPRTGAFRHHAGNRQSSDLLVVDEASMVSLPLFAHLFDALKPTAKIILLGDKDQLSSVENGSVFADLSSNRFVNVFSGDFIHRNRALIPGFHRFEAVPKAAETILTNRVIQLEHSYRFGVDSGIGHLSFLINKVQLDPPPTGNEPLFPQRDPSLSPSVTSKGADKADIMRFMKTRRLNERSISKIVTAGKAMPADRHFEDIAWYDLHGEDAEAPLALLLENEAKKRYRPYLDALDRFHNDNRADVKTVLDAFEAFRILCAVNRGPFGVERVNAWMEALLFGKKQDLFYSGRPVLVQTNDYTQQLFNGDIGVILEEKGGERRAWFRGEGGTVRGFAPAFLPGHVTAFAMTIHKSQGSEFDGVMMLLPNRDTRILTREIIYTGITRAKNEISIAGSQSIFEKAILRRTERTSGLQQKLIF